MSDDRTNEPSPYGHTPEPNGHDAPARPTDDGVPPAPPYDAPTAPAGGGASTGYGAPEAPGYAAPAAPAYGAPSYPAPAYDQSAYQSASGMPSSGQPNYAQQGYNAPAYGYGAAPRINPLAIVALVSSLVGVFVIPVIGQIVGIITGHISLKQIKTTGERGRGMALAGVLVGYISIGLGILLLLLFVIVVAATGGSDVRYRA